MCGISALINPESSLKIPIVYLDRMNKVVRHRGPDDEGIAGFFKPSQSVSIYGGEDTPKILYNLNLPYSPTKEITHEYELAGKINLGHRRLSIIGIAPTGHQPMSDKTGRYWITFNGEIYNYIELKETLAQYEYPFQSETDTEVLLAAYQTWGIDCLQRLNGMFSFVIFDRFSETIFSARDRFGIKPLYYWISPRGFLAIASEIKQFSVLPGWSAKLNKQRVYEFLQYGLSDHTDETMFENVFQFRGGEMIEFSLNDAPEFTYGKRLPVQRWYQLSHKLSNLDHTMAVNQFRDLFTTAVSLRLRADVPLGSCLSGGLDSSSIVCLMDNLLKKESPPHNKIFTFSACSHVEKFDERVYAEEVVAKIRGRGNYIYPGPEQLIAKLYRITWHQDEPFGSTGIFAQWNVFNLAAENGIKVMLDGQGADEQLAGYNTFLPPRFVTLLRQMELRKLISEMKYAKEKRGFSYRKSAIDMLSLFISGKAKTLLQRFSQPIVSNLINNDRLDGIPLDPKTIVLKDNKSIRNWSYTQLTASMLPKLLHLEDRDSMAYSIEARVPFVDHKLIEYTYSLPDEFKLYQGVSKKILRDSLEGDLPEKVRNRMDKLGFATPEQHWIFHSHPDSFKTLLGNSIETSKGIIDQQALAYFDDIQNGEASYNPVIWRIISFGTWMEVFGVDP